jgi:hypothetical protein
MVGFRFDLSAPHIVVPVRITGAQRVRWLNLILDTCQINHRCASNCLVPKLLLVMEDGRNSPRTH